MNEGTIQSVVENIRRAGGMGKLDEYHAFEPYDVEDRPDWVVDLAKKDKLFNAEEPLIEELVNRKYSPFQTGYLLDDGPIAIIQANTQSGKSLAGLYDMFCAVTGELPVSLRYDKGVDTGVKRFINKYNIIRFGRFDKETGEFIDKDEKAVKDGSWDCGTIKGAGKYPDEKIWKGYNGKAWITCTKQALIDSWWPKIKELIPECLIDKSRGNKGFNEQSKSVFLINEATLSLVTYESIRGAAGLESVKVWMILCDEEPPGKDVWDRAFAHCVYLRATFTPFSGITWSKESIFDEVGKNPDLKLYHCTMYDNPHNSLEYTNQVRRVYAKPEVIKARIWGFHADAQNAAAFDREKLNTMWRIFNVPTKYVKFCPVEEYTTARELRNIDIEKVELSGEQSGCWEMYEDVKPDVAYWLNIDTADGSENPDEVQDVNAGEILRAPNSEIGEKLPVIVASIRTGFTPIKFARIALYGAAYYNNALLCPENNGESGGAFVALTRDWPYYYKSSIINDATQKPTTKLGFTNKGNKRLKLFTLVDKYITDCSVLNHGIKHKKLLDELKKAIKGKGGRPDHPHGGTLDSGVAFGIGLYVWEHDKRQIRCNKKSVQEENFYSHHPVEFVETRPVIGSTMGLDARERLRNWR